MKCPICGDEFTPKRADAKTCGKASCRKKLQRAKQKDFEGLIGTLHTVVFDSDDLVDKFATHPATLKALNIEEGPEEWLARRVEETGSANWQWIKTGNPPGSLPDVKIPQKWELSDIDQALSFRGQWGKREVESKP